MSPSPSACLLVLIGFAASGPRLSAGDLAFEPVETWPVGDQPAALVAADFNNDTWPDIAVTNRADDTVIVLYNDLTGGFVAGPPLPVGDAPRSPDAADLNNDGFIDLAVPHWGDAESSISIIINDSAGGFLPAVTVAVGSRPRTVAAGDLDLDGDIDLATANFGDDTVTILRNDGPPGYGFTRAADLDAGFIPGSVTIGRINNDMIPDIVSTARGSNSADVFIGQGGLLYDPAIAYDTCSSPRHETLADLDNDGDLDLAVACGVLALGVYRNRSDEGAGFDGVFSNGATYAIGGAPHGVATADLDLDGYLDIAVADIGGGRIAPFLNQGNATFDITPTLSAQSAAIMAIADVDKNDRPDLIAPSLNNDWVWVYRNRIPPPPCPADCHPSNPFGEPGDGVVNIDDLFAVVNAIGEPQASPCDVAPANKDGTFGNGIVNVDDLLAVVSAFGDCPD